MRSKTRSDVKWLVNEAAMLSGELERLDTEIARLTAQRESLLKVRGACTRTLSAVTDNCELPALPVVRAHRPYGGRGKLRQYLQDLLKQSPDKAFSTSELALRVIEHFNLEFSSAKALYHFKGNSIARGLHRLSVDGVVERVILSEPVGRAFGLWRWKDATPSIQEINALQSKSDAPATASEGV